MQLRSVEKYVWLMMGDEQVSGNILKPSNGIKNTVLIALTRALKAFLNIWCVCTKRMMVRMISSMDLFGRKVVEW